MQRQEKIEIFKSLFRGREDVFAVYWEKGDKKGYRPAYYFDPYRYRQHQMKGGTFQNFTEKSYLQLSDNYIDRHLNGLELIGLYPLLPDNTSWFIVADFDEQDWKFECQNFIKICEEFSIPAYLERSKSGNGGHVWIFFEKPYPAYKSRKIILSLLERSSSVSIFDKNSSFDRLFPNQDYLSGKGLGNLIALPLYLQALLKGNSCFVDSETFIPFEDQWQFLKTIHLVTNNHLELLYADLLEKENRETPITSIELTITLDNNVRINRNALVPQLINFLKEELNFSNNEFYIRKNSGKNTFGLDRYFKFIEEIDDYILLPKGFIGKTLRFCKEKNISNNFVDNRKLHKTVLFSFQATLKEYQKPTIVATDKKDIGVIVAPPGSGKTIMALKIVANKQQPALIIVHRKQLADQWVERIGSFLGILKKEIGKIGQGKVKLGEKVTIATIQSLAKIFEKGEGKELAQAFGLIIVDECHHIPATTFHNTISKFHSYYLYGLTATPFRKYNDGKLIFIHLGEVISEIKSTEIESSENPEIIIRNTVLNVPYNAKTDHFETLSKILVHDSERNKLILEDVSKVLKTGKKAVILTERKEHIDTLNQYLKQSYETVTLSGDDSESSRNNKWKILNSGNFQVLITTGQFFGEGSDLQNIQCLFLVYPFSFEGKLIQYIGRVQRSEITPTIYDYRDYKIDYLNKMFLKRNTYYRKIEKHKTLFDEVEEENHHLLSKNETIIEKQIKIAIEKLDFLYGSVTFRYQLQEIQKELEFDIENFNIRPEFEVLKTYFEKFLKSKTIVITICVVINNGTVVAQTAESSDINKFNREIVESVRFQYSQKTFFGSSKFLKSQFNDEDELQESAKIPYESSEELLQDMLTKGNYLHQKQMVYLSDLHVSSILKIRFVLNPFAFVFLLAGQEQYHIVMETLDTEEATYIWHLSKNTSSWKENISIVDKHLNIIRNEGRQAFLKLNPENFSRIVHDYLDERKGFVVWKDLLEERLV